MEEWKTYNWGDLITLEYGKPVPDKESVDGDIPVFGTNGQIGTSHMKPLCPFPSVIIGRKGAYRGVHYSDKPFSVIDTGFYMKPLVDGLNLKWAYYKFLTYDINRMDSGSAIPSTDRYELYKIPVNLPPIEEQNRVVSILDSIDNKITVNTRINHNLEEQAQALYKSWFVDFEPFKDSKFVESELGMIPEGWHVCKLDTLADTISGYSYKGQELVESNTAMATIKNFDRNGGFKVDGYKEIEPTKAKEEHYLTVFDLLVAHTDLTQAAEIIGNPALVLSKGKYEKLIMSMDLCKVKSRFTEISNSLLYCILKDRGFKSHALGYVNGTTVLHMSRKAIGEYKIAIPGDLSALKRLSTSLDAYFQKEAMTIVENDNLETLRNRILPRLMSGELNINETDC